MKPSILFILHLPPPIHGAAVVGKMIRDSEPINDAFQSDYINLTTSQNLGDIGSTNLKKVTVLFNLFYQIFIHLLRRKTDLCYITLNAKGSGFYKDFLAVLLVKLFRKKIVFHFHNKGVRNYSHRIIDRILYKICFRNTKSILMSPLLYHDISEFVKEEDVFYCPNGIPDLFANEKPRKIKNDNICNFLFISNMMVQKGVPTLLEACRILKDKGLKFKCDFVGAWSDFTETMFRDMVKSNHLKEHVFAHGKKYGKDKLAYLKNADAFVFPTYNDTFGLVLLEAMQAGLPIIATYEGGIPDVISENESGFLVAKKDAIALSNKMEVFIKNPVLSVQMGNAGRKRFMHNFTSDNFEKTMLEIMVALVKPKLEK